MIKTYKSSTGKRFTVDTSIICAISTMINLVNIHGNNGTYLSISVADDAEVDALHDEILKDWQEAIKKSKS